MITAHEYEEFLDMLDFSVQIVGNDYRMLWMNKASIDEGTPPENLIGRDVRELLRDGKFSDIVSPKVFNQKKTVTILASGSNGKNMLLTGIPYFRGGQVDKVIITSRDVTKLVNTQKEITEAKSLVRKYEDELEVLKSHLHDSNQMICENRHMQKTVACAKHIARTDSTVLIHGESGVGKEVLGRFIHNHSARRDRPCIKIDCGAIPENLLESELFGYEEGAFTGAIKGGKQGMVQIAEGGTLILDEIGELPLHMQAKLLRLIQDRAMVKIGGRENIAVDIRIIAITNKDLKAMIQQGRFREDLFYRLNVIPIEIPPLRERKDDIFKLSMQFLNQFNRKYNENKQFDAGVLRAFNQYDWPGNIRELENVVEMVLAITVNDLITADDLPDCFRKPGPFPEISGWIMNQKSYTEYLQEFEKELFNYCINQYGTVNEIACKLSLDRSTVRKKCKKYFLKK